MAVDVANKTSNNSLNSERSTAERLKSKALLHELQLGEQLSESVHQARRADFSLMLAMLCDDVREQSQFVLPQHNAKEVKLTTSALRKQFDLPKIAPLALQKLEQISQYNQAQAVEQNKLATLHLTNAINPKPLAFRDDASHVPNDVMSNTTVVCQVKHAENTSNAVLNKRLTVDVDGWLKNIQTSLVKSRLVSGIAA